MNEWTRLQQLLGPVPSEVSLQKSFKGLGSGNPLQLVISWIKQLMGGRQVSLVATVDHVELTSTHLVIGLKIVWSNRTSHPITVKDIQVLVHLNKRNDEPLRLYPLESFTRLQTGRGFLKTPLCTFTLPAANTYTEQLRFISQEVLDIPAGNYTVDVLMQDTNDASYTCRTKIRLDNKIKYRRSEEWQED